jgi:hypothetical protein
MADAITISPELDRLCVGLPGESILRKGLEDLWAGRESIESLLIEIGSPRLRLAGLLIPPEVNPDADYRLYDLLWETHEREAHSQYNSWIRELVSFERALERRIVAAQNGRDCP